MTILKSKPEPDPTPKAGEANTPAAAPAAPAAPDTLPGYPDTGQGVQDVTLSSGSPDDPGTPARVGKPIPIDLIVGGAPYTLSDRAKGVYIFRHP